MLTLYALLFLFPVLTSTLATAEETGPHKVGPSRRKKTHSGQSRVRVELRGMTASSTSLNLTVPEAHYLDSAFLAAFNSLYAQDDTTVVQAQVVDMHDKARAHHGWRPGDRQHRAMLRRSNRQDEVTMAPPGDGRASSIVAQDRNDMTNMVASKQERDQRDLYTPYRYRGRVSNIFLLVDFACRLCGGDWDYRRHLRTAQTKQKYELPDLLLALLRAGPHQVFHNLSGCRVVFEDH